MPSDQVAVGWTARDKDGNEAATAGDSPATARPSRPRASFLILSLSSQSHSLNSSIPPSNQPILPTSSENPLSLPTSASTFLNRSVGDRTGEDWTPCTRLSDSLDHPA